MRETDLTEPARAFSDDEEEEEEEGGREGGMEDEEEEEEEEDVLRAVNGSVQVAPDMQARAVAMGGEGEEMMRRVKEGMEEAVARVMRGEEDEDEEDEDEYFDR